MIPDNKRESVNINASELPIETPTATNRTEFNMADLIQAANEKERKQICTCGVPEHLHATACGWNNAIRQGIAKNIEERTWQQKWDQAHLPIVNIDSGNATNFREMEREVAENAMRHVIENYFAFKDDPEAAIKSYLNHRHPL